MMNSQDPAIVNIPLSRRGDIDAGIDRHKADERKRAKVEAKEQAAKTRELRAQAKAQSDLIPLMVVMLVGRGTRTAASWRACLKSMQHWEPARLLKLAEAIGSKEEKP